MLVYSSPPLSRDVEVTGAATVDLWAQSSVADTDFTAKLTVVKPDGTVVNLNDGILRTSFRDSLSNPTPVPPNQPTRYRIQIWPTSYQYRAGGTGSGWRSPAATIPQFAPNPQHR